MLLKACQSLKKPSRMERDVLLTAKRPRYFQDDHACECTPSFTSSITFLLNASRSFGLRLVTNPLSTITSLSSQFTPAFFRSVLIDMNEVMFLPDNKPVSINNCGPWQIAATGLPDCRNSRANAMQSSFLLMRSGLMTPPGITNAS